MVDAVIGNNVRMKQSVIVESVVKDDCVIGPFAYIRPGCEIDKGVKVGDFVEVKNSKIGPGSKLPHLSYVGDADVGSGVNVGCGAITVNYDGVKKHRTVIEDDAFIGCNTNLVAPVRVGKSAYTAAGSTINKDVPDDALAIAGSGRSIKSGMRQN